MHLRPDRVVSQNPGGGQRKDAQSQGAEQESPQHNRYNGPAGPFRRWSGVLGPDSAGYRGFHRAGTGTDLLKRALDLIEVFCAQLDRHGGDPIVDLLR